MTKFLTYAPLTQRLRDGEYAELTFFTYALSGHVTFKHKWYKSGSTTTYSYASTVTASRITTVVSLPGTETWSNVTKVEVWAEYGGVRVSDIITFNADNVARRDPVRLGWLNTMGGIDYYTFTGSRSDESFADKIEMTKDLPVPFTVADRGKSILGSTAYDEIELISDFEPAASLAWLKGLIHSPEVWIAEGSRIIPVVVTTKSHVTKSDQMLPFKVKIRRANDTIAQNG